MWFPQRAYDIKRQSFVFRESVNIQSSSFSLFRKPRPYVYHLTSISLVTVCTQTGGYYNDFTVMVFVYVSRIYF
jgi:hypothetical protein